MRMAVGPHLDKIIADKQQAVEKRSLKKLETTTEAGYGELMASSLSSEGTTVAKGASGARQNTTSTAAVGAASQIGSYDNAPLQQQQVPSNHPVSGTKLDWTHGPGSGDEAQGNIKKGGNPVSSVQPTQQTGPNEGAAAGRK